MKRKLGLKISVLPNLMTLGNGVCGLGAITIATKTTTNMETDSILFFAGLLIFLGMLFDMLDGQVARLTKQTSEFGAQLDSLCDAVTFGVAPVFIMLRAVDVVPGTPASRLLWGIGAVYLACTIMRLARYNVEHADDTPTGYFRGLPSPAAAGTVAAIGIAMPTLQRLSEESADGFIGTVGSQLIGFTTAFLPFLTLALALLMVSRLRYPHFFNQLFRGQRNFYQLVEVVIALLAVVTVHELALPFIMCFYVLAPPIHRGLLLAFRPISKRKVADAPVSGPDE